MKTEIQSLFARRNPDFSITYVWITTKTVRTLYDAKRERTHDQRIVRKATGRYPGHVVSHDKRSLHVFENAITPYETLKMQAKLFGNFNGVESRFRDS